MKANPADFTEQLITPGEHLFLCNGPKGRIEMALSVPEQVNPQFMAFIGHPHSLQGGTMNNKVVTTLVRAFGALHVASVRFNFRGVGQSEGHYDEGRGESEDLLYLASLVLKKTPDVQCLFAGFSFGSYVAYRAAAQCPHALLLTIAPAVHHYDYNAYPNAPAPWIMIHGDDDEVVPLQDVLDFVSRASVPIELIRFAGTGHFFHGQLITLKQQVIDAVRVKLSRL